jgi:hypothetical protein
MSTRHCIPMMDDGRLDLSDERTIDTGDLINDRMCCPFHNGDNTTIFRVKEHKNNFKCEHPSCNKWGIVVDEGEFEEIRRRDQEFRKRQEQPSNDVIDKMIAAAKEEFGANTEEETPKAEDASEAKADKPKYDNVDFTKIVREHFYTDENGKPVYRKRYYAHKADDGKTPIYQRWENGKYIPRLEGTPKVPYNLPNMVQHESIIYTEGEKDCDTLLALGIKNCTSLGSANSRLEPHQAKYFRGKDIILVPDHDSAGYIGARQIGSQLHPLARSVRVWFICNPGHEATGKDLTDSVEAHKEMLLSKEPQERQTFFFELAKKKSVPFEQADRLFEFDPENTEPLVSFLDYVSRYKQFPASSLPKDLQRYVKEMAASYMCPQDWFAGATLAVASSLLGNKVILPFGEWNVRPHFSFLIVCDKGTKKTHPIKAVMGYVFEQDTDADEDYRQRCKDHRAKLEKAKKDKDFVYTKEAPQRIHYFVSNITQEELAKIQNVYPQQIWYRDEFSGAISGCNQYKGGQGDDVQSCIERMDGTHSKCNRREWSADTHRPFLNALGTIQTDIVPQVLTGRLHDMGFADRFNFCLSPYIAPRVNPDGVPDEVKALLRSILASLHKIPMRYVDPHHEVKQVNPFLFEFTPEAKALATSFINDTIAPLCDSTEDKTIRGLLAKSETTFMNLCLLLHCLHHAREIGEENHKDSLRIIDTGIVEKAFKLAMYYAFQNYNVLTLGANSEEKAGDRDYKRLVDYMKRKKMEIIPVSHISQYVFQKKYKKTAEQIKTFLTSLAEQGKGSFDGTTFKLSV